MRQQEAERPVVKYLPYFCEFLGREVWAVMTKAPDGGWRVVNCLDKEKDCFHIACIFTTDGGEWPFDPHREASAPRTGRPRV